MHALRYTYNILTFAIINICVLVDVLLCKKWLVNTEYHTTSLTFVYKRIKYIKKKKRLVSKQDQGI